MKITVEDLSGDATTIKDKQPDLLSQEEAMRRKRLRSQDSFQNYQQPPSPQHTGSLNKELSPAVQKQILFAVDDAGPQAKPASRTSLSSENQHLVEKDFGSAESSTNFNP